MRWPFSSIINKTHQKPPRSNEAIAVLPQCSLLTLEGKPTAAITFPSCHHFWISGLSSIVAFLNEIANSFLLFYFYQLSLSRGHIQEEPRSIISDTFAEHSHFFYDLNRKSI